MKILLAEDHVLSQAMTVRLLQAEGYEVSVVGTGLQAVDACRDQSFDVVLMDVQLPVLDGVNAIREIRKLQAESLADRVPIWVLTADSSVELMAECLEAGADGHLAKPLRPQQLIERLRHIGLCKPDQLVAASTHGEGDQFQVLLESVGQDQALAESLVKLFQRDYDSLVSRFRLAFHDEDFQAITREAHSLKSPARVFGATTLHCLCDDLEKIGKTGDVNQLLEIQSRFICELRNLAHVVATFSFL